MVWKIPELPTFDAYIVQEASVEIEFRVTGNYSGLPEMPKLFEYVLRNQMVMKFPDSRRTLPKD